MGFTEADNSKRHGLGLMRRLIEQVGGSATLRSDHGAEWTLKFPVPPDTSGQVVRFKVPSPTTDPRFARLFRHPGDSRDPAPGPAFVGMTGDQSWATTAGYGVRPLRLLGGCGAAQAFERRISGSMSLFHGGERLLAAPQHPCRVLMLDFPYKRPRSHRTTPDHDVVVLD